MKLAHIDGLKLSYSEVNPDRPITILFLHGNSHGHKSFRNQLQEPKLSDYRLIAVDLPGHGHSSHLSDYSLIELSSAINKFINFLQLEKVVIVGHSLGGHVAIHLLNYIRPDGILTFGTPPLSFPLSMVGFLANTHITPLGIESATPQELEALALELRYKGIDKKNLFEDYNQADKNLRTQIFQSVGFGKYFDELELLKNYTGNSMTIVSSDDKIVNNEYIVGISESTNTTIKVLNCGHSPQLEIADQFNEALIDFVSSITSFVNLSLNNFSSKRGTDIYG